MRKTRRDDRGQHRAHSQQTSLRFTNQDLLREGWYALPRLFLPRCRANLPLSLLRHIQAVLWGFIGLGRRQDMSELHRSGSPILLIATGVVIALLLVAALIGLAMFAVRLAT